MKLRLLAATLLVASTAVAERPRITSQDQLPRFTYEFTGDVTAVVTSDETAARLAAQVRADLEGLLRDYDIADRTTVQGIHSSLLTLDLLEGRYADALRQIARIRELEEKPANKLTAGLLAEAYIEARRAAEYPDEAAFRAAFQRSYAQRIGALPWEVVADNLRQAKGSAEIVTEALVLGNLQSQFQPGVDKNGTISGEIAGALLGARSTVRLFLPLRAERVAVLTAVIEANRKEKPDIWAARNFELGAEGSLTPVVVGIWDSGVDLAIFGAQVAGGDGKAAGIAFDLESNQVPELLLPLTPEQLARYPEAKLFTKGLLDLQSSIDSPEAAELRRRMGALKPEEVKGFLEELGLFGNYTHGTHVAGIAVAGNPAARVAAARISFDYRQIPDVPTRERAERGAAAAKATVAYLKSVNARVVNMSWGGSARGIEVALELNGAGGTAEERKAFARELWGIFRAGLREALESAPEILFVVAAGNSDNDVNFDEMLPSGLDLPNMLTVGAVDQAGEETSFTSHGRSVDVHANGFEVESYIPGGDRIKYSGTSMAAPNVANLAAKLLAVEPSLTVPELIALITDAAEPTADGRLRLIHPQKSLALLEQRRRG